MAETTYPRIFLRISEEDKELIAQEAEHDRLTVSSFIRTVVVKEALRRRQQRERQLSQAA